MDEVIPKKELMRIMKRFLADENRGISLALFGELCGMDRRYLSGVFIYETFPFSERTQRIVSRAYKAFVNGEVAIMQNPDRTRFVEYRKVAKPRFKRSSRLVSVNGEIKLKVGIVNRADYSQPNLDESLRSQNGRST